MRYEADTIVAISTPPGRGGIGVVRLSGAGALAMAAPVLALRTPLESARARFTHVLDAQGEVLDEAVVTFFAGPHSYTAEDVVEISAHGAPVLLDYLVRSAIANGARLAEPGEFTQRAFLSGRLDLTQAEAVNDLIAAQTLHQARLAAAQLGGAIARSVSPVKQALLELIAEVEAGVDFAEDDLDLLREQEIAARMEQITAPLRRLAGTYAYGRIVREGVRVALVGRPNAGKSSLFNRLLERERAIVTAQPGTTRDPISERLAVGGIPVELIDTAGLREIAVRPENEAEREGIERSRTTMADADLVLHVVDATLLEEGGLALEDQAMQAALEGRPSILIVNKCDLAPDGMEGAIRTSAKTGDGLAELRQAMLGRLAAEPEGESAMIGNLRQAEALRAAVGGLERALKATRQRVPHEFVLLDLYEALGALDGLTGASTPEEILGLIFSRFCIGK